MEESKELTMEDIEKEVKELQSSSDSKQPSPEPTDKKEKVDEDDKPDYLKEEDVVETFDEDMCEVEEFG